MKNADRSRRLFLKVGLMNLGGNRKYSRARKARKYVFNVWMISLKSTVLAKIGQVSSEISQFLTQIAITIVLHKSLQLFKL